MKRCSWADVSELDKEYHDTEWGKEIHDDRALFECLVLESMQSGLSWSIILKKRAFFRIAFDNFDYEKISKYSQEKIDSLMKDEGIVRNKKKIEATINNARCFIEVIKEYGTFDNYIWSFVEYKPIVNNWKEMHEIPSQTNLSLKISKDLKSKGFKFLGPTTIYAFMQAVGMMDDHLVSCVIRENM